VVAGPFARDLAEEAAAGQGVVAPLDHAELVVAGFGQDDLAPSASRALRVAADDAEAVPEGVLEHHPA
jgi:hypothetical protein